MHMATSFTNERGEPRIGRIIGTSLLGIVALIILLGSWQTVGPTERGIRIRFGAVSGEVLQPGLYFKLPIADSIVRMDVRVGKEQVKASAASKDLQTVTAVISVNYQVDPARVVSVYQSFGFEVGARIVDPAIQESIKAATAQFTAAELVTKRAEVRTVAEDNLRAKVQSHGVILSEFNIVDFDFSPQFNAAIEAKVTQEQTALGEQQKLKTIEYQAQQVKAAAEGQKDAAIATAQGEAESIRIKSDALKSNPDFLKLKELDVQLTWAGRWNGSVPATVMGNTPIPFFNLGK